MKTNKFKLYLTLAISCFVTLAGCHKDFETKISDKAYNDSVTLAFGNPKVVLLVVDGARGLSVRDARTPVLTSMLTKSIYSWTSLSDEDNQEKGTNWADLLTGVKKDKHGVIGDNFANNAFDDYPLVFSRIKKAKPNSKIVSFASSAEFDENLTTDVDLSETAGTDDAVKAAVVNSLNTDTASLIVGQFKDVNTAGAAYGYDVSKAEYKSAIVKFDTEVGEILTALKARPNYASENWLVVVVSSTGGTYPVPVAQDDKTVFSNPKVNTFTIIHNPKYKPRFIEKPYLGNIFTAKGLRFYGKDNAVKATTDNAGDFNFGDTVQFTIELKVKKNAGPDNNYRFYYPSLLGKREGWYSDNRGVGWTLFLDDNKWQFNIRGASSDSKEISGGILSRGNWNSVAVVCVMREGKRYIRTFTDGIFNNEMEITETGNINNIYGLTLGLMNGDGRREPDVVLSDVRIWKKALTDETISQFACDTEVNEDHPYYDYLIGYWPCTDGSGNQLIDYGASGSNFVLQGDYEWSTFNDLICGPDAATLNSLVPRNIDISTQLLSWFRIPTQESWNLEGRVWLDQ